MQVSKISGTVLGFCRSVCKCQMQVREEKKKGWDKMCWQLCGPGMELDTDVLSGLSSPSMGRSEGGHSRVQQPQGQSLAVGTGNIMLQWMVISNCWPRKRWKKWGFPTNLVLKLSCPQKSLMVGWNISLAGSAAQVPAKGKAGLACKPVWVWRRPKEASCETPKTQGAKSGFLLFSVLWLTNSAQGQLVVPGRFFASPRDALM